VRLRRCLGSDQGHARKPLRGLEHTVIPIPNVNGRALQYVLEYIDDRVNNRVDPIEKPLKG